MPQLFFQYKTSPYLFDTKLLKLFRLENKRLIEITKPELLKHIRFDSVEIDREQAYRLAYRNQYVK